MFKSEVILLSVVEIPLELYETAFEMEKLIEHFKKEAGLFMGKLQKKFKERGIVSNVLIEAGLVVDKILDTVEKEKTDLIIMGSHGKRGLKRLLMGSVTEKVLNLGNKPVLIVKS